MKEKEIDITAHHRVNDIMSPLREYGKHRQRNYDWSVFVQLCKRSSALKDRTDYNYDILSAANEVLSE